MIVRDKPGPAQLLFALRGSVLPRIAWPMLALVAMSAVLVAVDHRYEVLQHSNSTPFAVFGVALSLFLGFRNNAAYDRWWEGRKLWGGLLADLRGFARDVAVFVPDVALRHALLRLALAFVHLHRANLRALRNDPAALHLAAAAGLASTGAHPPCTALDAMATAIADAHHAGRIDGFAARALTARLGSLAAQQAGCERIATTPLPYVYSLLIFRTIYLYCLLIPLALIEPAGWLTPLFVGIVTYVFLGLAEVTEDLAHPFGASLNGLPLDAMCRAVEISLAPHLGQTPPAGLHPIDFVLT
jgi:ion channel-forming bestrophin family protein